MQEFEIHCTNDFEDKDFCINVEIDGRRMNRIFLGAMETDMWDGMPPEDDPPTEESGSILPVSFAKLRLIEEDEYILNHREVRDVLN